MQEPTPISLRRRSDLTIWPWIKLRMAAGILAELSTAVDLWNLEHPFIATPCVSPDRLKVELRVTRVETPPILQWSANLGNAIGSLRAAADSIAWQIAHLGGNQPQNPGKVYFPTAQDDQAWERQIKNLGQIHPDLKLRFSELRSARGGEWLALISTLAKLNNLDKHRSWLDIRPFFESGELDNLIIKLDPSNNGSRAEIELNDSLGEIHVGAVVARLRFSKPIDCAEGRVYGAVGPVLSNDLLGDVELDGSALNWAAAMHGALLYAFERLCYGRSENSGFTPMEEDPETGNSIMDFENKSG